ncbi:MAG: heavy metal translocating P-type ATPase [Zoogloeaceae bacterium]|nr:heavy metal translocating P-type ATPase [Zoogloeaceae bacterium]
MNTTECASSAAASCACCHADAATNGQGEHWGRWCGALLLALLAEALGFAFADSGIARISGMALALVSIALAGFPVYIGGFAALFTGRLNINALMTVAVTGAFLIGEWPEAAMVMSLFAIAEAIEARAVDKARNALAALIALAPENAEIRQEDGSWRRLAIRSVAVGAFARVHPGERVPLDGVVSAGKSAVDQSPITGESLPIDKTPGDTLYAGSINRDAALEMRVTALATESVLARIVHTVETAQSARAPMQRFVDRFAAFYTPAVFALAMSVIALAPWLIGWSALEAVYRALVLLVVACPCALVISTPVTVFSGLTAAARRGILIKGGVHLESARKIKAIALDKTGTLTEGKPSLLAFEPLDAHRDPAGLAFLAQNLAARSNHPVSQAIATGLAAGFPMKTAEEVADFAALPGRGVQGDISGLRYALANHRWLEERKQCSPQLEARLRTHEEAGRSVTLLADATRALAICAVADTLKPSSAAAVEELTRLGVTPVILSGDNAAATRAVGQQAGIREAHGNLLPEDKLAAIDALKSRFGIIGMAGDGINDAPALSRADIGFAMGAGTHIAMEAADIVVMNDDLARLPETIRLSRRVHVILWQNIALALGIKFAFLLAALLGHATLWMAVFADMGASLLVIGNALRARTGASIPTRNH